MKLRYAGDGAGPGVVTVEAARLDAQVAILFKEEFRRLAGTGGPDIVLDLGQVDFLDSSGLGAVVAVHKLLAPRRLALCGLRPAVAKVMALTRLDTVIPIHADAAAARAAARP